MQSLSHPNMLSSASNRTGSYLQCGFIISVSMASSMCHRSLGHKIQTDQWVEIKKMTLIFTEQKKHLESPGNKIQKLNAMKQWQVTNHQQLREPVSTIIRRDKR